MNKKIGIIGATILFIVLISGGIFAWVSYYFALEKQKKEWYRKQYVQKSFRGKIKEIGNYSYDSDFNKEYLNITITTEDTLDPEIHYGMLSFKEEPLLKTFISEGDSVFKAKGEKKILFKKADGQTLFFKLPIDIDE